MLRPRVFVSSTIYDFRDLRSSLKLWLEEHGYDPQLSDHNDFGKPLDQNSYDACLSSIDSCEYFVLFIGGRVGGWFDRTKKISITRAEYEHAYERFKATGTPKIISFVRSDVWTIREDRKALAALLRDDERMRREITPRKAKELVNHQSTFVTDAETTQAFIDVVVRHDEMRTAVKDGTARPPGNWIHDFREFADVVTVLRQQLRITDVRRAAIVANLRKELVAIAAPLFLYETKNGKRKPRAALIFHHVQHALRERIVQADLDDTLDLTRNDIGHLIGFRFFGRGASGTMTTLAIEEAIRSGTFLRWVVELDDFGLTPIHQALLRLRDEIELLRRNETIELDAPLQKRWFQIKDTQPTSVHAVDAMHVLVHAALHDRHQNIFTLVRAILCALQGDERRLKDLKLWPVAAHATERVSLLAATADMALERLLTSDQLSD